MTAARVASIHARLLNRARERGEDVNLTLVRYGTICPLPTDDRDIGVSKLAPTYPLSQGARERPLRLPP